MTRRKFIRGFIESLFRLLSRMEISGKENLPSGGGVLLAVNHLSRLDPPLLFILLERDDATVLVADKYKKNPLFRWIIDAVDGIWLNREEADFDALRQARNHLRAGGLLGISPEGTRSRTGALIQAKTGAAYLVDKARVPVVPIAVWGTEQVFAQLARLRRPSVYVCIGEAFDLPPVARLERDQDLRRNTDEIMCRIALLLPPQYRGFYAGHPRLEELVSAELPELAEAAM